MSYLHPDYEEWFNVKGGPSVLSVVMGWYAYNPSRDKSYYATEYSDGWFSVDGDEWFGEFSCRAEAEEYLGLPFWMLAFGA